MAEQIIGSPEADVVAVKTGTRRRPPTDSEGSTAVAPPPKTRFVDRILPDMALFLEGDFYVNVPLEKTYKTTWNVLPVEIRRLVEQP